jgi:hypothetical protein
MWNLYTAEMLVGKQGDSRKSLVKLQHIVVTTVGLLVDAGASDVLPKLLWSVTG